MATTHYPLPQWTWDHLDEALLGLIRNPVHLASVRHLMAGLRSDAPAMTPTELLTEVLAVGCLATPSPSFEMDRPEAPPRALV